MGSSGILNISALIQYLQVIVHLICIVSIALKFKFQVVYLLPHIYNENIYASLHYLGGVFLQFLLPSPSIGSINIS